jgi:AMIN domain
VRSGIQLACAVLLPMLLAASALSQNAASDDKTGSANQGAAVVTSVRVVHERGVSAIEIVCTRAVTPAIQSIDSPPRIVIDLPNTRSGMPRSRIDVLQENILTIRAEQRQKPADTRIVVDFLVPYRFTWNADGNRLLVQLKPPEEPFVANAKPRIQKPEVTSLMPTAAPAFVPVTSGVGEVLAAGRRFAAGSSITAGGETAVLQLSRGGEVQVCPGTTLSVTPSKSANDLMMGLSTGAMEAHYALGASADTVLTPDFRILLAGPGEFDYAISTDSRGNTCVRGLRGNTSSAIVSELIGDRVYQVKPSEQAVFRSGRIDKIDTDVPVECGCPPPSPVPVLKADASPHVTTDPDSPNISLAQGNAPAAASTPENDSRQALSSGPETKPLPPQQPNDVHVQVEAPLVFRARNEPPAPSTAIAEAHALPVMDSSARMETLQVQALPPSAKATPQHRGILSKIGRFFASVFH